MTNPLSNTLTAIINFQLEIQNPKEGNWHLKVTGATQCEYRKEQDVRQYIVLVRFYSVAKDGPAMWSSDLDEVSTEGEEEK